MVESIVLLNNNRDFKEEFTLSRKRLLYLNNGTSLTSANKLDDRFKSFGLRVEKFWAFNNKFPSSLAGYDGIFISGSPHGAYENIPFINEEHELIIEAASKDIPMLGICFGQQLLASALCGKEQVFRRQSCEVGYKHLKTTKLIKNDNICSHLNESVYMFVWHNDEVKPDHPDLNIIAYSEDCPNHIFRYKDKLIWGIQGHPEITLVESKKWFEENRNDLEKDGANVETLIDVADEVKPAKIMIERFAKLI